MFSPQIEGLLATVDRISKEAKKNGALVSIESTIPRGTSKKVFEILNHRLHVAHAPHRWYALEEKEHGVNQPRVIGGVCDCCLEVAMQFYNGNSSIVIASSADSNSDGSGIVGSSSNDSMIPSPSSSRSNIINPNNYDNRNGDSSTIQRTTRTKTRTRRITRRSLGIPMHPVSTIEIAELSKIVENANRYLQIAFAEDLYLYCQANNINFSELRDAVNTKWNVHILEPRDGIGGHCLPKDTKMFLQSSKSIKSKILEAAMEADQDYRQYRQTRASRSTLYPSLLSSSSSNLEEDNSQAK
jgi:UDP-N-acetyl-D-mannosaminuronate dehydrogenase